MECIRCRKDFGRIGISLRDAVETKTYCPNCLAIAFQNNELSLINDPGLIDDVTGKSGAVEFVSIDERYVLERRSMMRLVSHNLKKNEYLALVAKYGSTRYMIHDDFYLEDGAAIQPML